jgi:hypothetical protein
MDQLIKLLQEKTGISDDQAKNVANFIQEHIHELPKMLGGDVGKKLEQGGLGGVMDAAKGFLGGKKD